MKHLPFVFALVAAVSVSCSNQPKPTRHPIGIVELTINPQAKLTTAALLPNQDSVVFTVNTFSVTTNGNQKYLNAKFDIENRSGSSLQDLTLVAYRQANNQAGTAIKNLVDFSGGSVNLDDYAKQAKPINGVNASTPITVNNDNADLQVLSEAEVSSLTTDAGSLLQSGEYLLPYGFVARANSNNRSIPTGTNAGTITVGIKVPDTNEPSTSATRFTMTFIAFTEPVTSRVTESLEEQNSNPNLALLRQTAFGATDLMTIGNSLTNSSKRECSVRIAGAANSPSAYLVNTPKVNSFTPSENALNVETNTTLTLDLARPLSGVATTDLVVRGSQTGEYAGSWSGTGSSNLTFTPNTAFKQGELITVGLKSGTVWCEAKNWQFLTKTTTEGGFGFVTRADYPIGSNPRSVALGDVNGDGKLDMVTANFGANNVSLLLGDGTGGFGPKTDFATGSSPNSVALGDVNGDGKPDIITANTVSTVSVLLGNGNGTFQPKTDVTAGFQPSFVALGDVNGDAKLDIVTANAVSGANSVSVLLGNGTGGFGTGTEFTTGTRPRSVALGDVNSDGKLDLVTANRGANTSSVLLGNGSGGFGAKSDFATGAEPYSVALGDVNGDGKLDVVTANNATSGTTASVLLGNGDGTLQAKTDVTVGSQPISVALGDVSGDGRLDIVATNLAGASTSVLLGNGDGTFQAKTDFIVGSQPWSVALGDVNGDGKLDIVTANMALGAYQSSVLLGNGSGGFATRTDFATGSQPRSVALGDVNGDGNLDVVTANTGSGANSASVLLGNGSGGFGTKTDFATGSQPFSVSLGDVNSDGKLDLVTANNGFGANSASVLLGNGDGTFQAKTDFATGTGPTFVALGDVNSDGKLDLVTANSGLSANSVSVSLGNGDGTFQAKTDFTTGSSPTSVAIGDVNGDGKLDLVTANSASGTNSASVLLGNGSGGFGAKTDFTTGTQPRSVALGDVNGDGKLDIVTANNGTSSSSVLLGDGTGGFGTRANFATGFNPSSVALGDVNGDGKLDIVTANHGNGSSIDTSTVLFGNGSGGFPIRTDFATGSQPRFAALGDVNSDGKLDLVTANNGFGANSISQLLKR